jgi:hypothetical protein
MVCPSTYHNCINPNNAVLAKEERIRLKAMLEQDRRENSGFGD